MAPSGDCSKPDMPTVCDCRASRLGQSAWIPKLLSTTFQPLWHVNSRAAITSLTALWLLMRHVHLAFLPCVASLSSCGKMMCRAWDHESSKQLSIYSTPGPGPSRKGPKEGMHLEAAPAEAETAVSKPDGLREPSTASTTGADAGQPREASVSYCNGADAEASADEQVGMAGSACCCPPYRTAAPSRYRSESSAAAATLMLDTPDVRP